MDTGVVDGVVAVATSPARLAGVMNLLHRGLLADAVGEERLNEILGRADSDVLTLEREAGYVPDADAACTIAVAEADGPALLGVVEGLHEAASLQLQVVLAADRMSEHERTVMWPLYEGAVAATRAFLSDLGALAGSAVWGALVEVTVQDGGVCWYREQAVAAGAVAVALEVALRQRIAEPFVDAALTAVAGLSPITAGTELCCSETVALADGRDRVTAVRAWVVPIDSETAELLGESDALDDVTRRELFDTGARGPVLRREQCRLLA